jgi:hypothetical protein
VVARKGSEDTTVEIDKVGQDGLKAAKRFLATCVDEEASQVFRYSQLVRCRAEKSGQRLTAHHRCKYEWYG